MDNQQIIDYILNTPQNTNPAILNQMLNELRNGNNNIEVLNLVPYNLDLNQRKIDKTFGEIKTLYESNKFICLISEEDNTIYGLDSFGYDETHGYWVSFHGLAWNFLYGENLTDYPIEDLG